jgi:hypothetical protein
MISAFQCDFSLAKGYPAFLCDLGRYLLDENSSLYKDIELLEELEFLLRHGKAEIHIIEK